MSLRQRCETAAAMRKENKTFREIGISLGVGPVRASQLVRKAGRFAAREPLWSDGLSAGCATRLHNHGFRSKEQLREAAESGKLAIGAYYEIGVKSILEIHAWLGLPEPTEITEERRATEAAIRRAIKLLKANGYNVKKISKD